MQTKISIKEISEKADVSIATVSRVINKNGRYSKETEERVWKVIRENNYRPNLIAKGLRERRMTNVGVLVPDIKNEFFTKLIYAIEKNLFAAGYETFVCNTDEDEEIEKKHVQMMLMQGVCGLIYIAGTADEMSESGDGVPTVYIDRIPKSRRENDVIVTSDNVEGGYLAGKELLEQGCVRPVIVTSRRSVSCYEDRKKGFDRALDEAGIPAENRGVILLDGLHYQDAYDEMTRLLDEKRFAGDGIFASADWLALGCYQALREHGAMIPDEVKIVGYDDISITAFNAIPITTVHQEVDEMGRLVVEQMIRLLEGEHVEQMLTEVPVYLVPRQSTRG